MSSTSLTVGFAHTPRIELPSSLGLPSTSYCISDLKLFAVGYFSGVIILVEFHSSDAAAPRPRFYLTGHRSPIVGFDSVKIPSPSGKHDVILLSLSIDGKLCKWDAVDGRCLQSVDSALDIPPRGLTILPISSINAERKPTEFNWLTDYYILLHGCSTTVTILSFTTLTTISLWTGHRDWPILLPIPGKLQYSIFTFGKEGISQLWTIGKKSIGQLEISRVDDAPISIGETKLGDIISARLFLDKHEDNDDKILLVQSNGLSIYKCIKSRGIRFELLRSVELESDVQDASIWGDKIFCFQKDGATTIYGEGLEILESIAAIRSPDYRVVQRMVGQYTADNIIMVALVVKNDGTNAIVPLKRDPGVSEPYDIILSREIEAENSAASALFEYNFVYAMGHTLKFYTLDQYLLDLNTPSHIINLPNTGDQINLLQTVQLGKTATSKEKSYLLVGLHSGAIHLVDPESFQLSSSLSLHSSPISGVLVLPEDLSPRIRSTLLVYSSHGSAAVVDVIPASGTSPCKARTLLSLPSGMSPRKLACIATQKAKSLLLFIDTEGRKRLWDVDSSDGGVLMNDTDSRNSSNFNHETRSNEADLDSSQVPWREHWLSDPKSTSPTFSKSIVHDGKLPSRFGYPTATVDVLGIIRYLHKQCDNSEKNQILAPDDEVLFPARSLLTVFVDYLGLLDSSDEISGFNITNDSGQELNQLLVQGLKSKISLAQVSKDGIISIHIRDSEEMGLRGWGNLSPRAQSQVIFCMTALLYTILHLTTASEAMSEGKARLSSTLEALLIKEKERHQSRLDLALLSEYWADSNPWIRASCRIVFEAELALLNRDAIKTTVEYWQDFLPTQISPELFSLNDVLRSVIILSVLIISLETHNRAEFKIDRSLRRNVALSIELFLTDSDHVYQDAAIDLVSEGWLSWQNEFDAFEAIHILMRLFASPNLSPERTNRINSAFVKIAEKNAPLLASGLANCICHAVPEKGSTSTTLTELINLSISAKKTVVSIIKADPYLFAEPQVIKVIIDAVVKVLDPQGGQIRDRVIQNASEVVNEVVDAYPTVAFHRPTQKLAISSTPRSVTVYDLSTAKAIASLEGQSKTAQFLTFSQDGKTIVAADLEESQLLVWKMATGLFSSFIGAAANIGVLGAEGAGVIAIKARHGFKNSKGVGMVKIDFSGDRSVKVTAGADTTLLNI